MGLNLGEEIMKKRMKSDEFPAQAVILLVEHYD